MIQTVPLNCSVSTLLVEPNGSTQRSKSATLRSHSSVSTICCSASKHDSYIPKLEPFSRNKFDRIIKDPPLIEKSENQLADYCVTLEGDECCSCWEAYFELKDLEKETTKKELESLIIGAGGVKSLIGFIHMIAANYKAKKERNNSIKVMKAEKTEVNPCPIPDGLPKTQEELDEEEKARMPDSPFTRLLRVIGRHPSDESYSLSS